MCKSAPNFFTTQEWKNMVAGLAKMETNSAGEKGVLIFFPTF
jgi:hypothetical protein